MRYYEAIYIANPNLEDEGLSKLVGVTKELLKKRSGELLYEEVMGKKRLAYPVEKQRYGTYVLLQFKSDGVGNTHLNRDLELNDEILAHMIVTIDEEDIRRAKAGETEQAASDKEGPKVAETSSAEPVAEAEVTQDQEPDVEERPTTTVDQAGAEAPAAEASSADEDPQPETEK